MKARKLIEADKMKVLVSLFYPVSLKNSQKTKSLFSSEDELNVMCHLYDKWLEWSFALCSCLQMKRLYFKAVHLLISC